MFHLKVVLFLQKEEKKPLFFHNTNNVTAHKIANFSTVMLFIHTEPHPTNEPSSAVNVAWVKRLLLGLGSLFFMC